MTQSSNTCQPSKNTIIYRQKKTSIISRLDFNERVSLLYLIILKLKDLIYDTYTH